MQQEFNDMVSFLDQKVRQLTSEYKWPILINNTNEPEGQVYHVASGFSISVYFGDSHFILNHNNVKHRYPSSNVESLGTTIDVFLNQDAAFQSFNVNRKLDELISKSEKYHDLLYSHLEFMPDAPGAKEAKDHFDRSAVSADANNKMS